MRHTTTRVSFITNPDGVLYSVLSFGLQAKVQSNNKLYFYKYDIYDLIEIYMEDDLMNVFVFRESENKADVVIKDIEFYKGYFESAGLVGKRFLFNAALRLIVNYNDFEEVDVIPKLNDSRKEFAFIMNKKDGYVYGKDAVNVFIATERTYEIDKCIIAFVNDSKNIINPNMLTLNGCMTSIIISGLLSKLNTEELSKQIPVIDLETKFKTTINSLTVSSRIARDSMLKLKTDKFRRIIKPKGSENSIQAVTKEISKGEVSLRDIIDNGLDRLAKSFSPNESYRVVIDCENQTIRSAYVLRGTMFITPVTMLPLSYFIELLNSDNVEYVLN